MIDGKAQAVPRRGWLLRLPLDAGAFFLLYCLYLWLFVDPRLIHHSLGVLTAYFSFSFSTDWPFLQERFARPGGLVEYAAGFLSQFYSVGWAGALIVTLAAWAMALSTDVLTGVAGVARGTVVRYVPAIVLLMLHSHYGHPLITVLSLLAGLVCFALYTRWVPESIVKRLPLLLVMCVAAYQVAGARGLLFPSLVTIYEFAIRRQFLIGGVALIAGAGTPWLVNHMLGIALSAPDPGPSLFQDPGLRPEQWPYPLVLCSLFPVILLGACLCRAASSDDSGPAVPPSGGRFSWLRRVLGCRWTQTAMALAVAGAAVWYSIDPDVKTLLQVDYYAQSEQWDQVLEAAGRLPREQFNLRANRNILLALARTGRLGDEMFRYRQINGVGLFITREEDRDHGTWFQESRLYLEVGLVNHAERCAYDALGSTGDLPAVLEHLALISIVKDQPGTARILLNALRRNPFYRRTAEEMLGRIEEDPRLDADPRVRHLRSIMSDRDIVDSGFQAEPLLLALLEKNPKNKAAFEFLMAHYLTTGWPDKVAANLWRLGGLGYATTPRHYQEAVVMCMGPMARGPDGTELAGPEVREEAMRFGEIVRRSSDRETAARDTAAAGLGGTYFSFLTFGYSGL